MEDNASQRSIYMDSLDELNEKYFRLSENITKNIDIIINAKVDEIIEQENVLELIDSTNLEMKELIDVASKITSLNRHTADEDLRLLEKILEEKEKKINNRIKIINKAMAGFFGFLILVNVIFPKLDSIFLGLIASIATLILFINYKKRLKKDKLEFVNKINDVKNEIDKKFDCINKIEELNINLEERFQSISRLRKEIGREAD